MPQRKGVTVLPQGLAGNSVFHVSDEVLRSRVRFAFPNLSKQSACRLETASRHRSTTFQTTRRQGLKFYKYNRQC